MVIQRCDSGSTAGDCDKIKAEPVTIGGIHEVCTVDAKTNVFSAGLI